MSVRLWVLSDLHLEFEKVPPALDVPDADVCVMAGDLLHKGGMRSLNYLAEQVARRMPVVFVAGNHEFYGASLTEGRHTMKHAELPGVHFLDDDMVVLDGVRFLGSTLWTDFCFGGGKEWNMHAAESNMNDYKAISLRKHPTWSRLRPMHTESLHWDSRRFLEDALRMEHDGPTVVVTHHAPSGRSVHPRYKGSALNAAFASDMDEFVEHHAPDLWVHGHMHDSSDYVIGETRVVSNPKGYFQENPGYDPALVIDLSAPAPKP